MDAQLCRSLNLMSLEQLSSYLGISTDEVNQYYQELLDDASFLETINLQIQRVKPVFNKGLFSLGKLDSVDWFAIQRILLYVLVRIFRPKRCLETGVFYGGNSCFILQALHKNKEGELISIDLPGNELDPNSRHYLVGNSEHVPSSLESGFLVPDSLKEQWTLVKGNSLQEIPKLKGEFNFYVHDSDHAYDFLKREMSLVWEKLSSQALMLVDDLDWSNGFFSFCDNKRLFPLIITDNGKSGLRARTGVVYLGHHFRTKQDIVGNDETLKVKEEDLPKTEEVPYSKTTRKVILDIINKSNAAHIGASFSVVDILEAIYKSANIDKIKKNAPDRDRVVLSKGHAAAALYSTLFKFDLMSKEDLETYNLNGSLLSGHVNHLVPHVEHSTGALGHGLPVALGMAIGLRSRNYSSKVFVVVGDGELHEGSNWEAIMLAGHLKINNFYVLVDNNHLSQMGVTDNCCSLHPLKSKFEGFNFKVVEVNGHDNGQIYEAIQKNQNVGPMAIICQTVKGKGVSFMENDNLWHYRTPKEDDYQKATLELDEKL